MVKYVLRRIYSGASAGACEGGARAIVAVATSITATVYIKSLNYLYFNQMVNKYSGESSTERLLVVLPSAVRVAIGLLSCNCADRHGSGRGSTNFCNRNNLNQDVLLLLFNQMVK